MYKFKLDQFEGPLDLLLQLIEQQELNITQVSLAKVTDQYVAYIDQIENANPEELGDFLVIAAKLLLIKSRSLLPSVGDEIETEAHELETQLKIYKEYLDASKNLHKMILQKKFSFPRPKNIAFAAFIAPEGVDQNILLTIFSKVLKNLEPLIRIPKGVIKKVFSLKEKIKAIQALIFQGSRVEFKKIIDGAPSKIDIIISFLALLELVKQRSVVVAQEESFEEIIITRNENSEYIE